MLTAGDDATRAPPVTPSGGSLDASGLAASKPKIGELSATLKLNIARAVNLSAI